MKLKRTLNIPDDIQWALDNELIWVFTHPNEQGFLVFADSKSNAWSLAREANDRIDDSWECSHPKGIEIAGFRLFAK